MLRYVGGRLLLLLITLWLISTMTFVLMHSIPGDPFTSEKKLPEQTLKALKAKYNLDKPLPQQYLLYIKNLATGDLGISIKTPNRTVNEMLEDGFPVSARLGLQAIVIASLAGIVMGMIAAVRQNRPADMILMFIAVLGISIPSFVLGPLLQKYFGLKWELFPLAQWGDGFWGEFKFTVLPSIALAFTPLALVTRLMRSSMLDVLGNDYIRTAQAKGLPPLRVLTRHTLRNAIIPVVTIMGPLVVGILTGSFVIEKIFSIPGIGKYFVESISTRDFSVIMGVTIFYSGLLILMNFFVDLVYGLIDPRIKLGEKEAG
ncbi:ABC transporter permease [Melghirimyces algeriensis]|uniref:Peptide/nickel transport system permease protein/oligopeptide transport system permease protein n=1 Tax=Melghirimyces algeriensis TaxID=910412 RepID=A0A521AMT9_9BACL|nr:ABC transporter permease [Melghirimyces algeriensis]SMO36112.1 peptide/nickel transport system permease protein/oligopeptide transport system permease protein [Melghirimyces algeriensis]